jgi:hypothetical protein
MFKTLYVQNLNKMFYYLPPCPRGEERSDEPCGHGGFSATDRVQVFYDRRRAGSGQAPCRVVRTVD